MASYLIERRRRLLGVAGVSALFALLCAGYNGGMLGGFPPQPQQSRLQVANALVHVLIDEPSRSIVERKALRQHYDGLTKRAELLGRVMVSPPVLDRIARVSRLPRDQLAGTGRTTAFVPITLTDPDSERRASEFHDAEFPYRIEVQSRPVTPIIDVYTQAPTTAEAERLADAALVGLKQHLDERSDAAGVPRSEQSVMRQLGDARGGVVNGGTAPTIAVLTFITVFPLTAGAFLGLLWLRRRRDGAAPVRADVPEPEPGDDWPHTTRLLPWLLAGFIAILWLVPFNSIQLGGASPIDLKLDRLVLPFVIGLWVLAFALGPRLRPRIRLTWMHAGIGGLLAVACLGVVLNARYLNRTMEFDLSVKKLPLLFSYVSLFLITASVVRRGEVRAFITYSLGLAVILALGMIWEYRFEQNLFYEWSDKLLPGAFSVTQDSAAAVDSLGRRLVRGSAAVPLEAVAMLTLALPITLVRLMSADRRARVIYGLAACALVAAMFATYRKSALVAPVSVILTLAYFRRDELLKLAPVGMILVIVVSVLSPGAIQSTVSQFTRSDAASVPTVSDRASDYDAVRPDVLSHVAFGRGWGSYEHTDYRVLDSEILYRMVETGVLGLVAYVLVTVSVLASTRATIASRDPFSAPVALIGASGAVAFLVISFLYDVMAFPHGPYIFLYMSGLAAVAIVRRPATRAPAQTARPPAAVREPAPV